MNVGRRSTGVTIYTPSAGPAGLYLSRLPSNAGATASPFSQSTWRMASSNERYRRPKGGKVPSARDAFFARAYRVAYMEGVAASGTILNRSCADLLGPSACLKQLASPPIALPKSSPRRQWTRCSASTGWRPAATCSKRPRKGAVAAQRVSELQYGKRVEGHGVRGLLHPRHALAKPSRTQSSRR